MYMDVYVYSFHLDYTAAPGHDGSVSDSVLSRLCADNDDVGPAIELS